MTLMWAIYWIDVLENIRTALEVFGFGSLFIIGFWCLVTASVDTEELSAVFSKTRSWLITAGIFVVISLFIPSQKTMYAMGAAYAGQQIIDNPKVQELGGNAFKLLNEKLKEMAGDDGKDAK